MKSKMIQGLVNIFEKTLLELGTQSRKLKACRFDAIAKAHKLFGKPK